MLLTFKEIDDSATSTQEQSQDTKSRRPSITPPSSLPIERQPP